MTNFRFFLKNVATVVACFAVYLMLSGCDEEKDNPTQFTVTFDSNGGSEVPPQSVEGGKKAEKPDDPTRTGYTFDAWYKDEALTSSHFVMLTINYNRLNFLSVFFVISGCLLIFATIAS